MAPASWRRADKLRETPTRPGSGGYRSPSFLLGWRPVCKRTIGVPGTIGLGEEPLDLLDGEGLEHPIACGQNGLDE
jgi:hypothetical protein